MPASGKAKAVSDYEFLKNRHLFQAATESNDSNDSEFLPLKASMLPNEAQNKFMETSHTKEKKPGQSPLGIVTGDKLSLTQMLDDFAQLQMKNKVPVPVPWSPGMGHTSNPALFVTPEKSSQNSKQQRVKGKENFLEPQMSSTIPVPTAWSSDMVLKPNPALLITPDKLMNGAVQHNKVSSSIFTPMQEAESISKRSKEKNTVRFDLPSASSGEDTLNTSEDFLNFASHQSPITLKGCEDNETEEGLTPSWKPFIASKAYDPSAYSDESVLDESIQMNDFHSLKFSSDTNISELLKADSTSDRVANKLQELLENSTSGASHTHDLLSSVLSHKLQDEDHGELCESNLTMSKNLATAVNIPRYPNAKAKHKTENVKNIPLNKNAPMPVRNAGPEYLRTPPSQYQPLPVKLLCSQVVRESNTSSPTRSNYSFPFVDKTLEGDVVAVENTFARPEYNSSLRVRSELDQLCHQEVDVEKAVTVILTKSEDKRTELNEKASTYTNRMSNQFFDLVDLEPSVDSLCSRVVRMRTSKSKRKKVPSHPSKSTKVTHNAPDLMEFLPADLQRETLDFSLPGVKPLSSKLKAAPHEMAFDLYKHNRVWHNINDY